MTQYWRIYPGSGNDENRNYLEEWLKESCIGIDFRIDFDLRQFDFREEELQKPPYDLSALTFINYFVKDMNKGDIVVVLFGGGIRAIGRLPTDFDSGYWFNFNSKAGLRQRHLRFIKWEVIYSRPYEDKRDEIMNAIRVNNQGTIQKITDEKAIDFINKLRPREK